MGVLQPLLKPTGKRYGFQTKLDNSRVLHAVAVLFVAGPPGSGIDVFCKGSKTPLIKSAMD